MHHDYALTLLAFATIGDRSTNLCRVVQVGQSEFKPYLHYGENRAKLECSKKAKYFVPFFKTH